VGGVSWRALMSSIMRWRSGLMASVPMANSRVRLTTPRSSGLADQSPMLSRSLAAHADRLPRSGYRGSDFVLWHVLSVPATARVGPEVGLELKIAYRSARPSAIEDRPSVANSHRQGGP
jgi:hypothetical protein